MNTGINKVIRERPSDALSALAVFLTSNAEKKPIFEKFECEETLISGKYRSFETQVFIDFAGESKCRHIHIYTYEQNDTGEGEDGQNALADRIEKAMHVITTDLNKLLARADLTLVKKTDLMLKKYFNEHYSQDEENKSDNEVGQIVLKVCSEALVHGIAKCYDNFNTYNSYGQLLSGGDVDPQNFTKLMFTILNGGKSVNSKVKFAKFYLILKATANVNMINSFLKLQKSIITSISSSKSGLAGFKVGIDGSYFNAFDTIPESLKILEDAINNCPDGGSFASIGFNCESDSFYNAEQNKYDMEGPKNLFDPSQMADWYIKLIGKNNSSL
jgi:hypothetical protein